MKLLWHTLLLVSAILVIINFTSLADGSMVIDITKVVESFKGLHFSTDYLDKFRDFAQTIEDLKNSNNFWDNFVGIFKAFGLVFTSIFFLLLNSITNIVNVLVWLVSLGFTNL